MAEYCKECGEKLNFFSKVQSRQDICLHCFNEENLARIAASRALKKVSESVDRVFPIDSSTKEVPVRELCSDSESKLKYADEKPANPATIYCRLCSGKLSPESKFCRNCGQLVREAPTTIQETDYVDTDCVDLHPQPTAQTAYQQQEYYQQEYQQPQPAAQPQPTLQPVPQPAPKEDPMEKLAKLKKMVEAGLITEEDYNTKKTEILAKM